MKILTRERIITFIAVAMSIFHLYTAGVRPYPAIQQRGAHLTFTLILIFLIFPLKKHEPERKLQALIYFDLLLVFFSFFVGAYSILEYEELGLRAGSPNLLDSFVSFMAIALVIEATRRLMGMAMCIVVFFALAYAIFGSYLPSAFAHSGYSFSRIVNHMFLSTQGILGTAVGVSGTVIIVFLIFGSFLEHSGALSSLTSIGLGLFGRFKAGSAKAAILGSYLFGCLTGSQTANVAAVGTITIPLMIKGGYKPMSAAAIEALASTGSMLTPPMMGAAAFIIPEIIGGTYVDVMRAAIIPGLLFYVAVFVFVHLQASKSGLTKMSKKELPRVGPLFKQSAHLFIPILALLYLLIIQGISTKMAGFWTVIIFCAVSMLKKETRMTPLKILSALAGGARNTLIVAIACASAGVIEGVLTLTGMGLRFSEILILLSGGDTLILLFLTMIASLIIGLPLPPVTAYLILAILAAPALIKSGIHPMAAHLFVFYFGVLGNITPPSAPCSFAAAGIARTHPLKTTNLAFLISAPTFIVPYMVIYSPELMLNGSILAILFRIVIAVFGISGFVIATVGFFIKNLNWILRVLLFIASILLIYHNTKVNIIGFFIIGFVMVWQKFYGEPAMTTLKKG